jgi:hypothetical protein
LRLRIWQYGSIINYKSVMKMINITHIISYNMRATKMRLLIYFEQVVLEYQEVIEITTGKYT